MNYNTSLKDSFLFILGAFFASFVLLSVLYPSIWFYHTSRLLPAHDTVTPWESTFILVSHFFHGGIQLWDRFDQMNNAFFVLSNGVYGVVNILTAYIFIIFSSFSSHPGEDLYHVHLILFYGFNCLVRTIGGYVLLRKLVTHRGVLFISLLYLNTILTSYMMSPGIITQSVYSLLPLLLYFILCFFEEFRLRNFLLVVMTMVLCFASTPLFTLGYFYQAVHFFIMSCGLSFLFQRGWVKLRGRPSLPRAEAIKNIGLLGCCFLIILPYFWWIHSLTHDFYVDGSGLGGTNGRFNNIFNLSGYFNVWGKSFSDPSLFLGTSLNYRQMWWGESWGFVGGTTLFFALMGIFLSKDKRKYIFLATILFVLLINTPCDPNNFFVLGRHIQDVLQNHLGRGLSFSDWAGSVWLMASAIAHGINALTNPLCFLVRSFHMTSLLIPMLMLPLVAMGLESCWYLWQGKAEMIHFQRRWILVVFFAGVICWALAGGVQSLGIYLPDPSAVQGIKEYILSLGSIFFAFTLMSVFFSPDKRWVGWIILALAFTLEFVALKTYTQWGTIDSIAPMRTGPLYTNDAIIPDFQNPKILSLKEFINVDKRYFSPEITAIQGMYGAFYQYIPMGRFFHKWYLYEPRHISYKGLYPDFEIQRYLINNQQAIFFADYAFDSRYINFDDILRLNLEQRVVIAEEEDHNKAFLKTAQRVYISPQSPEVRIYSVDLDWKKVKKCKVASGWEHTFDLPKDFPSYLATTVFTNDYRSWQLTLGNRILSPMQGVLTTPFTYDVQNIQENKLTVLLPDDKVQKQDIKLQVKLPERILNVWKNTYDDLGLTYDAPQSGWLVFNYPYDQKWDLTIDGQKALISKVNRYFIGAPITKGQHQVLLRYWPHTSLRWWIFISMVVSTVCFVGILFYSLKLEGRIAG